MGDGANQVGVYADRVTSKPCQEVAFVMFMYVRIELANQLCCCWGRLRDHLHPSLELEEL